MLEHSIALADHVATETDANDADDHEFDANISCCQLRAVCVDDLLFKFVIPYSINTLNGLFLLSLIVFRHFLAII